MRFSPTVEHLEAGGSPVEVATTARLPSKYRVPLRLADAERIASGLSTRIHWATDSDVLDLPDPIDDMPVRRGRSDAAKAIEAVADFDYVRWSRELEDLLNQPGGLPAETLPARHRVRRKDGEETSLMPAHGVASPKPAQAQPSSVGDTIRGGGRGRSTWMPMLFLLVSSAVMAGIIGTAAYGLSSVEMQSWMQAAAHWLDGMAIGAPGR